LIGRQFIWNLTLAASSLTVIGCSSTPRYREVANPNTGFVCGQSPHLGCGVTILDTVTGTVFEKDQDGWWEEDPKTGLAVFHKVHL
jgi:hypothetical protein